MIETMPNPLQDKGVQREIEEEVKKIIEYPGRHRHAALLIEHLVKTAAEWGMVKGFRMAWLIQESTKYKK